MKARSILFVDQYASIGGAQKVLISIVEIVQSHKVRWGYLGPLNGNLGASLQSIDPGNQSLTNIEFESLTSGKKTFLDFFRLIINTYRFNQKSSVIKSFEFLYCNGPRLIVATAIAGAFLNRKVIYHIHLEHSFFERLLIRIVSRLPQTHRVFFVSRFIQSRYQTKSPKAVLIPNALDSNLSSLIFCDRFVENKIRVGIFGRICPDKGQDRIIEIASEFTDIDFYIVGETKDQDLAFEKYLKAKAGRNIHFHPFQQNLLSFVDQFEINVCTALSRRPESFGLVAIESMAMSCLTIVPAQGGFLEVATTTGAITFKNDYELKEKIREIVQSHPSVNTSKAREQFKLVQRNFSHSIFLANISSGLQL